MTKSSYIRAVINDVFMKNAISRLAIQKKIGRVTKLNICELKKNSSIKCIHKEYM